MNEALNTKWITDFHDPASPNIVIACERDHRFYGLADVHKVTYGEEREGEEAGEGVANLIAAAPVMLEALRNLVIDWERVIGPIPDDHEAKAAITKAEGGAS